MNSSLPPLYPQEAYPEPQNAHQTYSDTCAFNNNCPNGQSAVNSSNFSSNIGNLIFPLLLKSMGGNLPLQDILKSLGAGSNPILNALSTFSDKKNTPTQCVDEKQFPEN